MAHAATAAVAGHSLEVMWVGKGKPVCLPHAGRGGGQERRQDVVGSQFDLGRRTAGRKQQHRTQN